MKENTNSKTNERLQEFKETLFEMFENAKNKFDKAMENLTDIDACYATQIETRYETLKELVEELDLTEEYEARVEKAEAEDSGIRYVRVDELSGLDWHDIYYSHLQLEYNGTYAIPADKVDDIIIDHLMDFYLIPKESEDSIRKAIKKNGFSSCNRWTIYENEEAQANNRLDDDEAWLEISFAEDGELKAIGYYMGGQYESKLFFVVKSIKEENLCYLVADNYLCPTKGVPNYERMMHPFFSNEGMAREYLRFLKDSDKNASEIGHEYELTVQDLNNFKESFWESNGSAWYKLEMQALTMWYELGKDVYKEYFSIFTESHVEKMSDLYNQLISCRTSMIAAIVTDKTYVPGVSVGDIVWTEGMYVDSFDVAYVKLYADNKRETLLGWADNTKIKYLPLVGRLQQLVDDFIEYETIGIKTSDIAELMSDKIELTEEEFMICGLDDDSPFSDENGNVEADERTLYQILDKFIAYEMIARSISEVKEILTEKVGFTDEELLLFGFKA